MMLDTAATFDGLVRRYAADEAQAGEESAGGDDAEPEGAEAADAKTADDAA